MNFETMRPVNFGSKPGELTSEAPTPHMSATAKNRRFAALKEAAAIVETMPGPGEMLHAIMTGRYDLTDTLEAIFETVGKVDHLRLATLSFNSHNVALIKGWLASGQVKRLTLLYSLFFRAHSPEIVHELAEALDTRRGSRKAASRNHCKVVTIQAGRRRLSLEGSANLRTNSNQEQFCLTNDAKLHDWHAAWIDAEVTKHEAGEREFAQAQEEEAADVTPQGLFEGAGD